MTALRSETVSERLPLTATPPSSAGEQNWRSGVKGYVGDVTSLSDDVTGLGWGPVIVRTRREHPPVVIEAARCVAVMSEFHILTASPAVHIRPINS